MLNQLEVQSNIGRGNIFVDYTNKLMIKRKQLKDSPHDCRIINLFILCTHFVQALASYQVYSFQEYSRLNKYIGIGCACVYPKYNVCAPFQSLVCSCSDKQHPFIPHCYHSLTQLTCVNNVFLNQLAYGLWEVEAQAQAQASTDSFCLCLCRCISCAL